LTIRWGSIETARCEFDHCFDLFAVEAVEPFQVAIGSIHLQPDFTLSMLRHSDETLDSSEQVFGIPSGAKAQLHRLRLRRD
jgi:hypothetical protein